MSESIPARSVIAVLRSAGCVFAEDEAQLLYSAASTPADLDDLVARRVAGVPLEHLLGWAEFCGLRIAVAPRVFVPRQRTAFLVDLAVTIGQQQSRAGGRLIVLDLCCGSGAVAAALLAILERTEFHAVDIDPAAVQCAERNLDTPGGAAETHVYEGDLYEPLPASLRGRVDLLVANAPYVPTEAIATMPSEARIHEPQVALDGGGDGLDVQRRVIASAPEWLAAGGSLLIETSERQASLTASSMREAGLTTRIASSEEFDATVVIGHMTV